MTDATTRVENNETVTMINAVDQESSFPEFEKDARHIEKIVTDEQVGKVVQHAHRVVVFFGGTTLMWQNVDLTHVDLTWQSNSVLFNTT